jgi:metallophosphoesterase (TIGR00282 family)
MKILFVGDVVGSPGRRIVKDRLLGLVDRHAIDFTIVNVENAAGGFGITPEVMAELDGLPIDAFTSGNHIWDKKEGLPLLESRRVLRPANYPAGNPGAGVHLGETAAGIPVAVVNLEGQVFMKALDSPFRTADRVLAELAGSKNEVKVIVVDFHAEATSEKQALGFYLDGRVSAVLGTHTHVPTADERLLPKGTAFLCDVGMTGPYDSVLGRRIDRVLSAAVTFTPTPFDVAEGDVRLGGAIVDVDPATGRASRIERVMFREADFPPLPA